MRKSIHYLQKPLLLTMIILLLFSSITVFAAQPTHEITTQSVQISQPVYIEKNINVTSDGGKYNVGFTQIDFKKSFIANENLPINFNVKIYAENGDVFIEFSPSVDAFFKDVKIHAYSYSGLIYDRALGHNIYVNIPNQILKVEHFSRYCFVF